MDTKESGRIVDKAEIVWLDIAKYEQSKGSPYIDLPKILKDRIANINVKDKDNDYCLRWTALLQVDQNSDTTVS